MKAFLKPTPLKIILMIVFFIIVSEIWNRYFTMSIDTIHWGFPYQVFFTWGSVQSNSVVFKIRLVETRIGPGNLVFGWFGHCKWGGKEQRYQYMANEEAVRLVEEAGIIMNAKSQAKKEQIISELQKARSEILTEVVALSPNDRNTVFLGIWSVKDLLAHLAGWDYANLEAAKSILAGKLPSFYEQKDRDWQTYNAMLVKKYRRNNFRALLATLKKSQRELVAYLKTIPPEHFNKDFGVRFRGYKVTIQRLLEADIKDVRLHCRQIVDFFGKA